MDWTRHLVEQLRWHWEQHTRPRLADLSDAEYFREPAHPCWSVRRRAGATTAIIGGSGEFVVEFARPEPRPAPVTTIAWRIAHIVADVPGRRTATHFGGPAADFEAIHHSAEILLLRDLWRDRTRTV
ncbi:MAG TPA: hypothetical protein VFG87_03795 [Amycolatopsis sp.]|jgi:hypothetical protein|nr:hypothetical protein [Amycolatopsis sp.]